MKIDSPKTYEVVKQYRRAPVQYKVIDTGPYLSTDPDFDVTFGQGVGDYDLKCSVTNLSTTDNISIVTTVWIAGSPTDISILEL